MIVYLSGPMTGIKNYNKDEFNKQAVRERAAGNVVLNPASMPLGLRYESYMDIAMAQIRACDQIVVLQGWEQSKGAKAEIAYANSIGKTIKAVK